MKVNITSRPSEFGIAEQLVQKLITEGRQTIPQVDHRQIGGALGVIEAISQNPARGSQFATSAATLAAEYFGFTESEVRIEAKLMNRDDFYSVADAALSFGRASPTAQAPQQNFEIAKRRLVNALIQGGAHGFQGAYHLLDDEILTSAEKKAFNAMMNHGDTMIFNLPTEAQSRMSRDPRAIAGLSSLDFSVEGAPCIKAQASLAPVLMHELGKGVLELVALHGLPTDADVRDAVLKAADRPEHEHRDFQVGVALWNRFVVGLTKQRIQNPRDQMIAFRELVSKPPTEFFAEITKLANS